MALADTKEHWVPASVFKSESQFATGVGWSFCTIGCQCFQEFRWSLTLNIRLHH